MPHGRLPEFLYEYLTPEHLDLINSWLREKKTKVPSMAVAPLAAGSLAVTEAYAALLGDKVPGSRRPTVLPNAILFDIFQMKHTVVDIVEEHNREMRNRTRRKASLVEPLLQ